MDPPQPPDRQLRLPHREKEALILQELSSTLHTLHHVSTVLEDIVRLTTTTTTTTTAAAAATTKKGASTSATKSGTGAPPKDDPRKQEKQSQQNDTNNIVAKQQKLLHELRQWKRLLPLMGGEGRNQGAD